MAEIRIKRQVVGAGQVGIDLSGDAVQVGGAVEYESSWLIERSGTQLCYSQDASSCQAWVTFTDPAAWRFNDRDSAERIIAERGLSGAVATEHRWMGT